MAWVYLLSAVAAEVVGTVALKVSDGFSKFLPSVLVGIGYLGAFGLLSLALRTFEVGEAYAIWSGTGTAAIAVIGMVALKESFSLAKAAGLLLIIGGVVLLNAAGTH